MKCRTASLALALCAVVAACGDDGGSSEPLFPADYAASYTEVRDCRRSADHDFNNIRVLADDAALAPYRDRQAPFPVGAVVLKEEYDIDDDGCSGEILQWAVMVKRGDGEAPELLDWQWQRVDPDRNVVEEDAPRCTGCHEDCGIPPDGYDGTCAVPSPGG